MFKLVLAATLAASLASDERRDWSQTRRARGQLVAYERFGLHFELFLPQSWKPPANGASEHPVLTFLHGRGESGGFDVTNAQSLPLQLLNNRSFADACPFITLVPQCPFDCAQSNIWLPETLQAVSKVVREWIVPELGGDRSRVYLAGQSMGGHGAWTYAAQAPRLFAAVVVVCGYAQGGREARLVAERLAKQRMAVAVYHSADDSVIPVGASDQMVAALTASGYSTDEAEGARRLKFVRYQHAPGPPMPEFAHLIGHGSYELAFRDADLYSWLLRQSCSRCSERPPAAWKPLDDAIAPAGGGGAHRSAGDPPDA